ncbi:hypothetical protein [Cupriavidus sp. CuC1]|uniref:hypothetical protein n=1 Tax=Cupriavidus sp. CuC1 TaxID=3373131 RepID=UPI0037CCEC25
MFNSRVVSRSKYGRGQILKLGVDRAGAGFDVRLLVCLFPCLPEAAHAHIKWFANVDLHNTPRSPFAVMDSSPFLALATAAVVVMAAVALIDAWLAPGRTSGKFPAALIDLDIGDKATTIMRLGMAAFLVAIVWFFRETPVVLTPELKANAWWLAPLQLGIAVAAASGRSALAGLGIALLYGYAVATFGVFHLLDYPIFIGISVLLCATKADAGRRQAALNALRIATSLTLMWGGVEKWLYPEWTFPLLCGSGRALLMGFSPDFFMQSAGFVEFCAAFAVLAGGVAARIAAVFLISIFAAAIPLFGMVDAVGHAPFLLALAVLALTPNPLALHRGHPDNAWRNARRWTVVFTGTICSLPAIYYSGHRIAYGPINASVLEALGVVALFAALASLRLAGEKIHNLIFDEI